DGGEQALHWLTVVRPGGADDHAQATRLATNVDHAQPASAVARQMPTPGDISGLGLTSRTLGVPAASSRTSMRRACPASTAHHACRATSTMAAWRAGAIWEA